MAKVPRDPLRSRIGNGKYIDDSEPSEPTTLRETPLAKDDDYSNRFTDEERITQNLRLRSIAPVYRAFIGIIAFLPPAWRGPMACLVFAIIGFLAARMAPQLASWIASQVGK